MKPLPNSVRTRLTSELGISTTTTPVFWSTLTTRDPGTDRKAFSTAFKVRSTDLPGSREAIMNCSSITGTHTPYRVGTALVLAFRSVCRRLLIRFTVLVSLFSLSGPQPILSRSRSQPLREPRLVVWSKEFPLGVGQSLKSHCLRYTH